MKRCSRCWFIFFSSRRRHTIFKCDWSSDVCSSDLFCEPVAVFVNRALQGVFETLNQLGRVRTFQWHGENREVADCYPFQMVAAFAVSEVVHLRDIARYLDVCRDVAKVPAAILIDAHVPGQYGGTGQSAPWDFLAELPPPVPVIL